MPIGILFHFESMAGLPAYFSGRVDSRPEVLSTDFYVLSAASIELSILLERLSAIGELPYA